LSESFNVIALLFFELSIQIIARGGLKGPPNTNRVNDQEGYEVFNWSSKDQIIVGPVDLVSSGIAG